MKRRYLFCVICLVYFQYSCSQDTGTTVDRRKAGLDSSINIPQQTGWANDFYNLFTAAEIKRFDSLISDFERKTTIEIALVTIDSSMMGPVEFEPYTYQLANTWGVGKKDKHNGIVVAIFPDIRKMRIENGYGIESLLTNEETKEIIDQFFIPHFKEGRYFEGTWYGLVTLMERVSKSFQKQGEEK